MLSVLPLGSTEIQERNAQPGASKHAQPQKDTVQIAKQGTTGKAQPSFPPCLVNLLLDASHPHHFALTAERVAVPSGSAGSCLDEFKTHVRDTAGTDAYLRALGSMDVEALHVLLAKACEVQGLDPSLAQPLAGMCAQAGLVLLRDRIASTVLAKMAAADASCSLLAGDARMRRLLLVHVSKIADRSEQVRILTGFGLTKSKAAKVAGLLGPWIPQEITKPTAQSASDVAKAESILLEGLGRAGKALSSLEPEIRHWQLSKEIDLIVDLEPEVEAAMKDLGLPSGKESVLSAAVAAHAARVADDRGIEEAAGFAIGLVCDLAGPAGALAGLPAILAGKKRLDDLTLLEGLGMASADAVDEARDDLLVTILESVVGLP